MKSPHPTNIFVEKVIINVIFLKQDSILCIGSDNEILIAYGEFHGVAVPGMGRLFYLNLFSTYCEYFNPRTPNYIAV